MALYQILVPGSGTHMCRRVVGHIKWPWILGSVRGKKTKAKLSYGKRRTDPTELALNHFDQNYRPLFGDDWPSIRLALLSMQSYGALVNNYSDVAVTTEKLLSLGVYDFIQPGAEKVRREFVERELSAVQHKRESSSSPPIKDGSGDEKLDFVEMAQNLQKREMLRLSREEVGVEETTENEEHLEEIAHARSLQQENKPWWDERYIVAPGFEHRMDLVEKLDQEAGDRSDFTVDIVSAELQISRHLQCFIHRDSPSRLPQAKKGAPSSSSDPCLQYYIMDPASVLPALALDLRPDEVVLDLCAGPGGKSLAILQTMLVGSLTANEKVPSRRRRLQEVFDLYLPRGVRTGGAVRLSGLDGCRWGEIEQASYDKVLVDVPCLTDRVSATQPDNNLFKVNRSRERWDLPQLQTELLCAGIQATRPGGAIVYSTCTMSPLQNDGVIQNAVATCREEFGIDTSVVDLSPMATGFGDVFSFSDSARYGQMVVPRITANFGPMYFAKLLRY